MSRKDDGRDAQKHPVDGTGAKGGKEALRPDEQEPMGVDPDSAIDAELRRSRKTQPGGLNPNTIVRN